MDKPSIPELPCLCGSVRRTARALTQMYEQVCRPLGLRSTQLTILQVLARIGEVGQGRMGEILAMDSTSLTRTLGIMIRKGWVEERRGRDRREKWLRLASGGEELLAKAMPIWEAVQVQLRQQLGDEKWRNFLESTNEVTNVVTNLGKKEGEKK
jgi:DNA-binding MarR family transcriptional regulator